MFVQDLKYHTLYKHVTILGPNRVCPYNPPVMRIVGNGDVEFEITA